MANKTYQLTLPKSMPKGGVKVIFIVTNMSTQCGTANKYYLHLYYHLKTNLILNLINTLDFIK